MKQPDTISIDPGMDYVLSDYGGLPRGYLTELSGPDGGGKTTLALKYVAQAQKMGLKVGYMDIEYALNDDHAAHFGVDVKKIDFGGYPPSAEAQFTEMIRMCRDKYGLVVLDSVPALMPTSIIEKLDEQLENEAVGSQSGGQYGRIAAFMSNTLPLLIREAAPPFGNTALLFINQLRANIRKFGMGPEAVPYGGYALKHYSSVRVEIRRIADIKYGTMGVIGFRARVRCPHKSRFAPPKRDGFIDIIFHHQAPSLEDINKRKKNKVGVIVTPTKIGED